LWVGIARGRSYASVLVIPQRKMSFCEAPNGRRPWPDLKLHGSSPKRGRRGGAGGCGLGGAARGAMGGGLQGHWGGSVVALCSAYACSLLCMREGEEEREEREKKRKGRKRKEKKIWKIF
jgi:hypothetical protein